MEVVKEVIELEEGERTDRDHDWSDLIASGTAIQQVIIDAKNLEKDLDETAGVIVAQNTLDNVTTFSVRRPLGAGKTPYCVTLKMFRDDSESRFEHYLII